MSKTKSKNRSELEHLRGLVRRLKGQLKYYKRQAQIADNDDEDDDFDVEAPEPDCPDCGKGFLFDTDLIHIKYRICNLCGYKENGRK